MYNKKPRYEDAKYQYMIVEGLVYISGISIILFLYNANTKANLFYFMFFGLLAFYNEDWIQYQAFVAIYSILLYQPR